MNLKIEIVIAGVQKAATTSLKNYIGEHPGVCTHASPEFGYFSIDSEYQLPLNYVVSKHNINNSPDKKLLIKNVDIIFFEEHIERVKKHNPEAKIILMLRNPVGRAYSAYWFARRRGWETIETFEEAIKANPARYSERLHVSNVSYLEKGNYAAQINTLYKYFNRKQVLVLLQEDLKTDARTTIKNVFDFCELENSFEPNMSVEYNVSAKARMQTLARLTVTENPIKSSLKKIIPNTYLRKLRQTVTALNEKDFTPPPINEITRLKLVSHFKPLNEKLAVLINRDLSHWNKV